VGRLSKGGRQEGGKRAIQTSYVHKKSSVAVVLMFVETPTARFSVLAFLLVSLTPSLVELSTLVLDAEFEIED